MKYLLSSDELVTASENTVFHALMYWIEERGIENVIESQEIPSLLSVVRFELIPFDYLCNIVQHHPVAKTLMGFNEHYLRGITYHASSRTMKQRLVCQPAKRRSEAHSFVAFTWVLPANKLDSDTLGTTGKTLKSDEFWYCGYKMRLVITKVRKVEETSTFQLAKLSLEIRNLTQQSEVSIWWQPTSPYFKFTPNEKTDAFDKKACLSSVTIIYEVRGKLSICPIKDNRGSARRNRRARPTHSSFTFGGASSTLSTAFGGVPVSNTQSSLTIGTASSTPRTIFEGVRVPTTQSNGQVRVSTTQPTVNTDATSSTPSTAFGGFRVPTTQPRRNTGTASSKPSISVGRVPVSTTQSGFNFGTASSIPSTAFGQIPMSTTQTSYTFGAASSSPSTSFGGARVSTTQSGFQLGTASSTPSIGSGQVPVSTNQPSLHTGRAPSIPSTICSGVPVATAHSSLHDGTASSTRSTAFGGVPVFTTQSSSNNGTALNNVTASSTPSTTFGGVPMSTTQSSFKLGTTSTAPSTGFGGVPVSTIQPGMTFGATPDIRTTSVTPLHFSKPAFSFTGNTNTVEPSKSDLTSKSESYHPSYVHIDLIMKLVE